MKEEYLVIKDFDEFVNASRRLVFKSFGNNSVNDDELLSDLNPQDQQELDSNLSYDESVIIAKNILKKQKNKKSGDIRYLVTDSLYMKMIEELNSRLISNILNVLVNRGLLESAFDTETNDFIFWTSNTTKEYLDDITKKTEKPETD